MCPSCVSAAASVVAGVASTGGIAAMALAAFRRRSDKVQSQHAAVEPNENDLQGDDMEQPRIVTRDEWVAARKELLVKEKALTDARDALGVRASTAADGQGREELHFDTPSGRKTLAELFDGRSQLMIYHFMMGPDWAEGCPSCSFLADSIDGTTIHLAHRDVTLMAVVARAARQHPGVQAAHGLAVPVGLVVRQRLQPRFWRVVHRRRSRERGRALQLRADAFRWTRRRGSACFSRRLRARCFTLTRHMLAVGKRSSGPITTSTLRRRGAMKKGLAFTMAWLRHHDRYDDNYVVDPKRSYADAGAVEARRKVRSGLLCVNSASWGPAIATGRSTKSSPSRGACCASRDSPRVSPTMTRRATCCTLWARPAPPASPSR